MAYSLTYGIKTTGEVDLLAVSKLGTEANYTIKLKWNKKNTHQRSSDYAD
jgi:hypothetical protein